MPHFIDRNFDAPLDLLASPGRRRAAAAARWLRPAGPPRCGTVPRRAAAPAVQLPGHVRRARADEALAIYAVITYMDSIEGVWFPDGGMRAVPRRWPRAAEKAGVQFRYAPVQESCVDRTAGWPAVDSATGAAAGRRGGLHPRRAHRLRALLPDLRAATGRRRPRTRRRPSSGTSACAACPDPAIAHHNIHFGASGSRRSTSCSSERRLMRDASRLVTVPSLERPVAGPQGWLDAVRPRACAEPARQDRLGPGARTHAGAAARLPDRRPATRPTS